MDALINNQQALAFSSNVPTAFTIHYTMTFSKCLLSLVGIVSAIGSYILPLQGQRLCVRYSGREWIRPGMTLTIESIANVPSHLKLKDYSNIHISRH